MNLHTSHTLGYSGNLRNSCLLLIQKTRAQNYREDFVKKDSDRNDLSIGLFIMNQVSES